MKGQPNWHTTLRLVLLGLFMIVGLNAFVIINPGEAIPRGVGINQQWSGTGSSVIHPAIPGE